MISGTEASIFKSVLLPLSPAYKWVISVRRREALRTFFLGVQSLLSINKRCWTGPLLAFRFGGLHKLSGEATRQKFAPPAQRAV
jgi:hypothetical protein